MRLLRRLGVLTGLLVLLSVPAVADPVIGLNPSGGQYYDLGGGYYAFLAGVQSSNSLVGETVTLANLLGTVKSGNVLAFYYAAGNNASAVFANISQFGLFNSDSVVAGSLNTNLGKIWNSLWVITNSTTVVFSNGSGGTTTWGLNQNNLISQADPFGYHSVPEPATLALLGLGLAGAGLVCRRRR